MLDLLDRLEDNEQTGITMLRMFERYLFRQEHILQEYYYILTGLCFLVFLLLLVMVLSNIYWRK